MVVADLDEAGATLGIGFVRADDFAPFLRRHPEEPTLPSRLAHGSLDRRKTCGVETGVGTDRPDAERADANARRHGAFVDRMPSDPGLLGNIADGPTAALSRPKETEKGPTKRMITKVGGRNHHAPWRRSAQALIQ